MLSPPVHSQSFPSLHFMTPAGSLHSPSPPLPSPPPTHMQCASLTCIHHIVGHGCSLVKIYYDGTVNFLLGRHYTITTQALFWGQKLASPPHTGQHTHSTTLDENVKEPFFFSRILPQMVHVMSGQVPSCWTLQLSFNQERQSILNHQ